MNESYFAILQCAFSSLLRGNWSLAENYLKLLPLEVQSSARAVIILYRNAFSMLDQTGAEAAGTALLAAFVQEVDANRSGKPALYAPPATKKSPSM